MQGAPMLSFSKDLGKKLIFFAAFVFIAIISYKINFSPIIGAEKQYFTFFQFFAPITGAFLGPALGALAVLFAQLINYFIIGKAFDAIGLLRLVPMVFAAAYFGSAKKRIYFATIPLACMLVFAIHPIGSKVWFYTLYWLIPLATLRFKKSAFFRGLGATFTAHAIGSTLWLYTVPMPASAWIMLIPIVAFERIMFAGGITASYYAFSYALSKLEVAIPSVKGCIQTKLAVGE